jgi:hypothetical protein
MVFSADGADCASTAFDLLNNPKVTAAAAASTPIDIRTLNFIVSPGNNLWNLRRWKVPAPEIVAQIYRISWTEASYAPMFAPRKDLVGDLVQ